MARYQMKVALFIAAHFGHVDLARAMLRQGVKSDDPTGYHPARMWCKVSATLIYSLWNNVCVGERGKREIEV